MWFRIFRTTSFSSAAGGGVRGTDAGTVHVTTTEDGLFIIGPPIFIKTFLRAGEITTEIEAGKDTAGTIEEYPLTNSNATGRTGKETDIGSINTGACKDGRAEVPLADTKRHPNQGPDLIPAPDLIRSPVNLIC